MEDEREYSAIEIEVAENLIKSGYEWIARNKNDAICAYKGRPVKGEKIWEYEGDYSYGGVISLFDDINWTDAEPVSLRDIVPQILT